MVLLLGACGKDKSSPKLFVCDKLPGVAGVRTCGFDEARCSDLGAGEGCFKRPKAHCYIRNVFDGDGWSDKLTASCFVTTQECNKDRAGVGTVGPPPVQTDCHEMAPDEVTF